MMDSDATAEVRDLVENHLSRNVREDAGVFAFIVGLSTIGDAFASVQNRPTDWNGTLNRLRAGVRDARVIVRLQLGGSTPV